MGEFLPIAVIALVIAGAITALMFRYSQRGVVVRPADEEDKISRVKIRLTSKSAADLADKLKAAVGEVEGGKREVSLNFYDEANDEMFRFHIAPGADKTGRTPDRSVSEG